MSLIAANEESDPSAILNGFWVTLLVLACAQFRMQSFLPCVLIESGFQEDTCHLHIATCQ